MTLRRKMTGLGLALGLLLGTFGLGLVAAQWLQTKTATATYSVSGMTITLASVNGTVNGPAGTVTCAATISAPSGFGATGTACDFELTVSGALSPASVTVTATASRDASGSFATTPIVSYGPSFGTTLAPYNGGLSVPLGSSESVITDSAAGTHFGGAGWRAQLPVNWGASMGGTPLLGDEAPLVVTYTITISPA